MDDADRAAAIAEEVHSLWPLTVERLAAILARHREERHGAAGLVAQNLEYRKHIATLEAERDKWKADAFRIVTSDAQKMIDMKRTIESLERKRAGLQAVLDRWPGG